LQSDKSQLIEEREARMKATQVTKNNLQANIRHLSSQCEEIQMVNKRILVKTQSYRAKMIQKVTAIEEHATPV